MAEEVCLLQFRKDFDLLASKVVCKSNKDEFLKGLRFSPDGSLLLTSSESNYLGLWSPNTENLEKCYSYYPNHCKPDIEHTESSNEITLSTAIAVGDSIYDFAWYPHMNRADSTSNCFVTTSRDHPVHLWDTETGAIRCSYRGYDHMDELDAAQCLAFNCTGTKLYTGSNRMIRCFDVSEPGRNSSNLSTTASRRTNTGQKGIISSLAFSPDYSGLYAAGSYAQSVCLYAENEKCTQTLLDLGRMSSGVTHMRWSPCGTYLWIGGRRHPDLVCWDIRATGRELGRVTRSLNTNQRVSFDLDPWGKYLVTGSQDREILVYDTSTFELVQRRVGGPDCVNSISFHPFCSILGLCTGQRHFTMPYQEGSDSEEEEEEENTDNNSDVVRENGGESTLQLWRIGRNHVSSKVTEMEKSVYIDTDVPK